MIRILRGPRAALEAACGRCVADLPARVHLAPPWTPRSWGGIRNLLTSLARTRGRPAVEAVLRRHRPAASRVLPRFTAELSPGVPDGATDRDIAAAHRMTACPESHLSHNLLVQRPLFEGWAALLADLLGDTASGQGRLTLVVPDVARMDRESLGALRTLYRRHPDRAPSLVLGFDPERPDPRPDSDGVLWEIPVPDVFKLVLGFQAQPGAEVVAVGMDPGGSPGTATSGVPPESPWEDPVEAAAWVHLAHGAPLDAAAVERISAALLATFQRFSFTATLRLGMGLLASGADLTRRQAADVHALVALAAHNRQFRSLGNRPLARFLEAHLHAAWSLETRPARRSALAYRLAVTVGRRLKQPDQGLEWGARAVEEAEREGVSARQRTHLTAWGYNIRGYTWMEKQRLDRAREDCERAFALLDTEVREAAGSAAKAAVASDPLLREIAFTHALLADNLAALAELSGDDDAFERWKEIGESPVEGVPGLVRFEGLSWVRFHRRQGRLDRALPHALEAMEAARREQDPLREYRYTVQAADLLDRLGRHEEALERLTEARELRARLGNPPFLSSVSAVAGATARRAGDYAQARKLLEEALEEATQFARAEILAALGRVAAEKGEPEEAERRIGQAVDAAIELGERDVLLRVAVAAGEASLQLGRRDEARDAFERAAEIADAGPDAGDTEPPATADLLAIRLGLLETAPEEQLSTHQDMKDLEDLSTLLPEALDDADTWERLPRLRAVWELANLVPEPLARALGQRDGPAQGGVG